MEFLIIGHRPAEGADSAVILRSGVPHQVWETVNRYLCSGFLGIGEKQFLSGFLRSSVLRVSKTSGQCGLDGGRKHNSGLVIVLLQGVQKRTGKAEVALHKIFWILRSVHTCEIEYEVSLSAILVQLLRGGVQVILVDFLNLKTRSGSVFVITDISKVIAEGGSHHALCSGY